MLGLALAACPSADLEPDPEPEPATAPPGSAPGGGGTPGFTIPTGHTTTIHYKPLGLSSQYAQYFGEAGAIERLSQDLGAVTPADSAALEVAWDNTEMAGTITLFVPEVDTHGEALVEAIEGKTDVPVPSLQPLLRTIGAYREYLGGRYDLRILSFELRLSFWDKRSGTNCWINGAIGDPEGNLFGPCFRCLDFRAEGGYLEACRDGEGWPAPVTGDKDARRRITSALESTPI
ncbi:MAG: hypothetical protein GY898_17840 [Proteobacteria bacterium]|nr:hypothetical protein [Pseudomonadota bacterium]